MSDVEAYLSNHLQPTLDTLINYCRFPSVTITGEAVEPTIQFVEALLQNAGFTTQQLSVNGAPPTVYAEQRGRSPYTLLLYNHYDVQPAGDLSKWDSPPFTPAHRSGKLFARGIADNKGEFIARLLAIQALRDLHGELPLTVRWIIEGEEEMGSPHFGAFLQTHGNLCQADACLWEGAGFTKTGRPELCLGKKGLLYLRLSTQTLTSDAHSGLAGIMPSAAWHLVQALTSIRGVDGRVSFDSFYDDIEPPSPAQQAAVADQPDIGTDYQSRVQNGRFINNLSGRPLRNHLFFEPTCNIAGLSSGFSGDGIMTIVPAHAQADIDFRLVPEQDPHKIVAALRAHLDNHGFADVEIEVKTAVYPVAVDSATPFVQEVTKILTTTFQHPPVTIPISEKTLPLVSILKQHLNIPGLGAPTNPIYPSSNQHAPNEHIRITDFVQATRAGYHLFNSLAAVFQK